MKRAALAGVLSLAFAAPVPAFTPEEIAQAAQVARQVELVSVLADDAYLGRNNDTPASTAVQELLIDELALVADGLNVGVGDAAYRQAFATSAIGTNLVAVIPGTDLASEYVMIGAHYDHLGSSGPAIYNGATDNASGAAVVIAVGRALASLPTPPRRSVILALWDAEEDGLVGSKAYAAAPLRPLASTKAYVNLDIQGANLLPSLRRRSFAIGAESGGTALQGLVQAQVALESVETGLLARMFGQDRSDHASFIDLGVPSVFFSDATGPCYHTENDDIGVVDLWKLREQSQIAFRVVLELAETSTPPTFVPTVLLANTFVDALQMKSVLDAGVADLGLFAPAEQSTVLSAKASVDAIVADGPGTYTSTDQLDVGLAALNTLNALATLQCDGFLEPDEVPLGPATGIGVALALGASGILARNRVARGSRRLSLPGLRAR